MDGSVCARDFLSRLCQITPLETGQVADEIVTSRDAALANLNDVLWGCIATPTDDLKDIPAEVLRLDTDKVKYVNILFILGKILYQ